MTAITENSEESERGRTGDQIELIYVGEQDETETATGMTETSSFSGINSVSARAGGLHL